MSKPAVSAKYLGNIPNLTGLLAKEPLSRTIDSLVAWSNSLTNIDLYRALLTTDAVPYRATILPLSDPAHRSLR
jgi:hypothetical protein